MGTQGDIARWRHMIARWRHMKEAAYSDGCNSLELSQRSMHSDAEPHHVNSGFEGVMPEVPT